MRVIAATNRDLLADVEEGRFREDLYYRLSVFPLSMPPLRDRKGDVRLLASALVQQFSIDMGKAVEGISRASMTALESYSWPGNVRELRNVIERAMILSQGPLLEVSMPVASPDTLKKPPDETTLEAVERCHILSVLESTHWRVSGHDGAAEILGLKPTTLNSRIKKLGIRRPA